MQPIFDPRTRGQVNTKSKNGNWLTSLIYRESTFDGIYQNQLAQKSGKRAQQNFAEDEGSDEEEHFFKGSAYHTMVKAQRQLQRKLRMNEEAQTEKQNQQIVPYFIQRPAIKIALLNERQRQKSGLVTAVTMPVANNSQID